MDRSNAHSFVNLSLDPSNALTSFFEGGFLSVKWTMLFLAHLLQILTLNYKSFTEELCSCPLSTTQNNHNPHEQKKNHTIPLSV
jgi:hypothetical protein